MKKLSTSDNTVFKTNLFNSITLLQKFIISISCLTEHRNKLTKWIKNKDRLFTVLSLIYSLRYLLMLLSHLDHHIVIFRMTGDLWWIWIVFLNQWMRVSEKLLKSLISHVNKSGASLSIIKSKIIATNLKLTVWAEIVLFFTSHIYKILISGQEIVIRFIEAKFSWP